MRGETGILFSFCLGSHGQRMLAVGLSSRTTTHDHRKPRGDRGYQYWDIKGGSHCLVIQVGFEETVR